MRLMLKPHPRLLVCMDELVKIAITSVVVIRMVVAGYLQPPGKVMSWPMFSRGTYIEYSLTSEDETPVNVFRELPAHRPMLSGRELNYMLEFLTSKYGPICGSLRVHSAHGTKDVLIAGSRVVG